MHNIEMDLEFVFAVIQEQNQEPYPYHKQTSFNNIEDIYIHIIYMKMKTYQTTMMNATQTLDVASCWRPCIWWTGCSWRPSLPMRLGGIRAGLSGCLLCGKLLRSCLWMGTFLVRTLLEHSFSWTLISGNSSWFQTILVHSTYIYIFLNTSYFILKSCLNICLTIFDILLILMCSFFWTFLECVVFFGTFLKKKA